VPVAAVRKDGEQHFVWRVGAEDSAQRVEVEVGMANDFSQEVHGELKEGDRVVTGPGRVLAGLTEGQRLRIRETEVEPEAEKDAAE
jgi:HlyD family secretion protein